MKGTLAIQKVMHTGKPAARILVRGNVGQENRDKLTALGMTPVVDISNCREKICTTNDELIALRDTLIAEGIVAV